MTGRRIVVRPVTRGRWDDMARLFSARGCPHYCWCMVYRSSKAPTMGADEKRQAMRARVARGTPVGVLAYAGPKPVGWCSVAPRETYARLERSRTMPRVCEEPTWTVLCFFVRRDHRRQGITRGLLRGAVKYARAGGATFVEGYPYDTAGISSTHRGKSSAFKAVGFRREGKRWVLGRTRPKGTGRPNSKKKRAGHRGEARGSRSSPREDSLK